MNSVIAYKQFSLGEGLAELFAQEIKNLETFKKSLGLAFKNQSRFIWGYDKTETGHDKWDKTGGGWDQVCHDNAS